MSVLDVPPPLAPLPPPPKEEASYEIIDGQWVELPPMSVLAKVVANVLAGFINGFARAGGHGRAVVEVLFRLPLPRDRNRLPDVGYVSYDRWPRGRPIPERDNAWNVVPDLVSEVVSPTDPAEDL